MLLHVDNMNMQGDKSRTALMAENGNSYVLLSTGYVQIPDLVGRFHTEMS